MEIHAAARADGGKIHAGVLVDDVRAEGDMVSGGHIRLIGLIEHAVVQMREALRVLVHIGGERATISHAPLCALLDGLIHPGPGFLPHAEGTVLDGGGHMFGSAAEVTQLKIVDGAGAVARQMGNDALLNQGDQVAAEPVFDNVRTHGQDDRASVAPRRHHALDQFVKIRVFPRRNRVYPRGFQILNFYQVDACLLYTSASIARRCSSVNCIFPPRFSARACSRFALLRRWPQV